VRVLLIIVTAILCFNSCRQPKHDREVKTVTVTLADTVQEEEPHFEDEQILARKYIETLYDKVKILDTTFIINGLTYDIKCRHFCKKDNGLTIPKKYNPDIKKDFKTHNFATKLTITIGKNIILNKTIEKSDFKNHLDTTLNRYATLLFPYISLTNDTISVNYSISIPGTDVGRAFSFRIGKDGHFVVNGM